MASEDRDVRKKLEKTKAEILAGGIKPGQTWPAIDTKELIYRTVDGSNYYEVGGGAVGTVAEIDASTTQEQWQELINNGATLFIIRNTAGAPIFVGYSLNLSDEEYMFLSSGSDTTATPLGLNNVAFSFPVGGARGSLCFRGNVNLFGPIFTVNMNTATTFERLSLRTAVTIDMRGTGQVKTESIFSNNYTLTIATGSIPLEYQYADASAIIQQQGGADITINQQSDWKRPADYIKNLTAGNNISITGTRSNPVITGADPTTAGQLIRQWFTGETVTTPEGTFYLSLSGKGVVPNIQQNISAPDDSGVIWFSQDLLGYTDVSGALLPSGDYGYSLTVSADASTVTGREYKYHIEVYLADSDGVVIDSGIVGQPIGSLGVKVITSGDSGFVFMDAGSRTQANILANIPENIELLPGQRIRRRIGAEKIGTVGGPTTLSLYYGSDNNSYVDIPVPVTLQLATDNGNTTTNEIILDGTGKTEADRALSVRQDELIVMSLRANGKGLFLDADIFSLGTSDLLVANTFKAEGKSFFGTTNDFGATLNVESFVTEADFLFDTGNGRPVDGEYDQTASWNGYDYYTKISGTPYVWYFGVINTVKYGFIDTILRTPEEAFTNALYVSEPNITTPDSKAYTGQLSEAGNVGAGVDLSAGGLGINTDTLTVRDQIIIPNPSGPTEALNLQSADTRFLRKEISDTSQGSLGLRGSTIYNQWGGLTVQPAITFDNGCLMFNPSTNSYFANNYRYTGTDVRLIVDGYYTYLGLSPTTGDFVFSASSSSGIAGQTAPAGKINLTIKQNGALVSDYTATAGNHLLNRDTGDNRYTAIDYSYSKAESDAFLLSKANKTYVDDNFEPLNAGKYLSKTASDTTAGAVGLKGSDIYGLWNSSISSALSYSKSTLYYTGTSVGWSNNLYYDGSSRYVTNGHITYVFQNYLDGSINFVASQSGLSGEVITGDISTLSIRSSGALVSDYTATAGNHLLNRDAGDGRYLSNTGDDLTTAPLIAKNGAYFHVLNRAGDTVVPAYYQLFDDVDGSGKVAAYNWQIGNNGDYLLFSFHNDDTSGAWVNRLRYTADGKISATHATYINDNSVLNAAAIYSRHISKLANDTTAGAIGLKGSTIVNFWATSVVVPAVTFDRGALAYNPNGTVYLMSNYYYDGSVARLVGDGYYGYFGINPSNGDFLFLNSTSAGTANDPVPAATTKLLIKPFGALVSDYIASAGNHLLNRDAGDGRYLSNQASDTTAGALGTNGSTAYAQWGSSQAGLPQLTFNDFAVFGGGAGVAGNVRNIIHNGTNWIYKITDEASGVMHTPDGTIRVYSLQSKPSGTTINTSIPTLEIDQGAMRWGDTAQTLSAGDINASVFVYNTGGHGGLGIINNAHISNDGTITTNHPQFSTFLQMEGENFSIANGNEPNTKVLLVDTLEGRVKNKGAVSEEDDCATVGFIKSDSIFKFKDSFTNGRSLQHITSGAPVIYRTSVYVNATNGLSQSISIAPVSGNWSAYSSWNIHRNDAGGNPPTTFSYQTTIENSTTGISIPMEIGGSATIEISFFAYDGSKYPMQIKVRGNRHLNPTSTTFMEDFTYTIHGSVISSSGVNVIVSSTNPNTGMIIREQLF